MKEADWWNLVSVQDLFQNIDVRNLAGGSMGNPFQLRVKVQGTKLQYHRCRLWYQSNFADFGEYFRSTCLVVGNVFIEVAGFPLFLLQQPEVHLHPRAQAELSSLLATAASQGSRGPVVHR